MAALCFGGASVVFRALAWRGTAGPPQGHDDLSGVYRYWLGGGLYRG